MRARSALFTALLLLSGCGVQPVVSIDPLSLDCIPVVPLAVPGGGNSTGLLLEDGSVLTCSHGLARDVQRGQIVVNGEWREYDVRSRGGLVGGGEWKVGEPPASLDDWAVIALDPPIDRARVGPCTVAWAAKFEAPRVGETVYFVGFTAEPVNGTEESLFVRYWVPFVVIPPPANFTKPCESTVVWLKAPSRRFARTPNGATGAIGRPLAEVRPGFSGGPLLRVGRDSAGDARFEVCAIMQGKVRGRDDMGTAIVPIRAR